ncbi:MAG TPA: HAD family phosphatase [Terriglobales bacterium]
MDFKLPLPPGDFKAYLFDCDGTVADSMPLHYLAWSEALGEWNCKFSEERFYELGGVPIVQIIERLGREQGVEMPVAEVAKRKEELYFEYLPKLQCVPEVLEHIEQQQGRIPFAIVSGSTRDSVEASLRVIGLLDRFDILVCAGDYARSKPDPEPFLIAAQRLGMPPQACLVFEDTQMGIDSATAAGMASVRVPPPWERMRSTIK